MPPARWSVAATVSRHKSFFLKMGFAKCFVAASEKVTNSGVRGTEDLEYHESDDSLNFCKLTVCITCVLSMPKGFANKTIQRQANRHINIILTSHKVAPAHSPH